MTVKIENMYLEGAISLLLDLPLKGKESRNRTKFRKMLLDQYKEVDESKIELGKEHAKKDKGGKPIIKKGGIFDIKDNEALLKDVNELLNESIIIEGENNKDMLLTVKKALEESEKEWSGSEAIIYDYLCEQFEGIKNNEEEGE